MMRVAGDTHGLRAAVEQLKADRVVAYPTETVYGLAVNPFSEIALDALFAVKRRDEGKPVLLIVADSSQTAGLVAHVPNDAARCIQAFWPGPLSLLFPAASCLPERLTDGNGHVCVRCPDHDTARRLCRQWGGPLTSTSANLSGQPPAQNACAAAVPGVALVIDEGTLESRAPSTVFDPESKRILREGPITADMLEDAHIAVAR